jgi:hypothetical protein
MNRNGRFIISVFSISGLIILSFSCQNSSDAGSSKIAEVSALDSLGKSSGSGSHSAFGLIHETVNLRVFGDTTIDETKISYGSIKFEPYIGFDDFRVNAIDHSKHAELDLRSNKFAYLFRTRLKEGYSADTANFAGHYTLVYWGCGSGCKLAMIIDRKTGKIYDAPESSRGYLFKVNSRMLLVNPPDSNGYYDDCPYCKPIVYIFDEHTKSFAERERGL